MSILVGTRVPATSLKHAAMGLDLSPDTSKSAIIRAALALFHGLNPHDYLDPPRPQHKRGVRSAPRDIIDITGNVPDKLAEMPQGIERSTAIRIGLAMANGWSREDAEAWANMPRGPKPKNAARKAVAA